MLPAPGFAGPPSHDGVVIVRAGVGDEMMRIVVRLEVGSLGIVAEGELQDRHAGKAELLAQSFHLGRDDAEILGDDRQVAQRALQRLEQRRSRALSPMRH